MPVCIVLRSLLAWLDVHGHVDQQTPHSTGIWNLIKASHRYTYRLKIPYHGVSRKIEHVE